jgi:hypothetical protein
MAEDGRPEYQRLRPPLQKRERTRFEDLAADGEVVVAARNVGRLGVRWGVAGNYLSRPDRGERRLGDAP